MKFKKKILNQNIIKKNLDLTPNFLIVCISDLFLNLNEKFKKLCKNDFKYPNLLFNFYYSNRVQNYILSTKALSILTFLKLNCNQLKIYGFTFLYYNFYGFKEFSTINIYFFESIKIINFLKVLVLKTVTLSSSNGKDIALSR